MNYFGLGVIGRPFAHSWPTLRPVAAGWPVLPGWRMAAHGRADQVTTDHLFFRLTLAKLRYSSTRRRRAPGSTYGSSAGPEGTARPGQVTPANLFLGFHARHSATTCRNTPRVFTGAP